MSAILEQPISLKQARCGEPLRILSVRNECPASQRLRELGFCEEAVVSKLADGSAMICRLCGIRVAIARDLGERILVERL